MPSEVTSAASELLASAVKNVFSKFSFSCQTNDGASPLRAIHSSWGACFFCHSAQCSEPSRSIFAPHCGQRSSWQGMPSRWGIRVPHFGQMQNPPEPSSCKRCDSFMAACSSRFEPTPAVGGLSAVPRLPRPDTRSIRRLRATFAPSQAARARTTRNAPRPRPGLAGSMSWMSFSGRERVCAHTGSRKPVCSSIASTSAAATKVASR